MVTSADSSLSEIYISEESTWGESPSSPTVDEVRITGESLKQTTQMEESDEIRGDYQNADLTRTFYEASGGINFELSFGTFDTLYEHLLSDSFSSAVSISGVTDIGVTASGPTFDSTSTDFTANNISVGQWIQTSGFSNAGNNGYFEVTSVATNTLTVRDPDNDLVDETSGQSVSMDGSVLTNGTTKKSLFVEKRFTDISEFLYYTGMRTVSHTMNIPTQGKLNGSFEFQGKKEDSAQSTQSGSTNSANTNEVYSAGSHVDDVRENHNSVTIVSATINVNRNPRSKPVVGSLENDDVGLGTYSIDGNLELYFSDDTQVAKYHDGTETSWSYRAVDGAGNAIIYTLPAVELSDAEIVAGGKNQDVVASFSWQAKVDTTRDAMIQIDSIAA